MIIGLQKNLELTKRVLALVNVCGKFTNWADNYGVIHKDFLCRRSCIGVDAYMASIKQFVLDNKSKYPNEMFEIEEALREIKITKGDHICFNFYKVVRIDENLRLLQFKDNKRKIFISHAEKDKKIIKSFVALFSKFGLTREHVFCSSVEGYNIPIGSGDMYDYLLNEFTGNELLVLMFLSDNYYSSAACLNEMGAAWIRKDKYQTILMPGFDFVQIKGAINPRDISFRLDDVELRKSKLDELKDLIFHYLNLPCPEESEWIKERNKFIKSLG
ncbi:MAG: hypothetical protein ACI4S3_03675 [Candidatus Gastranaerophilaceae bacterium]